MYSCNAQLRFFLIILCSKAATIELIAFVQSHLGLDMQTTTPEMSSLAQSLD